MGGSVSFIDGHIDNVDRCVCCGKIIPEGRQVCFICDKEKPKKQTNYDRIRNMSVEEMAEFIFGVYDYEDKSLVFNKTEYGKHICGVFIPNYNEDSIKAYLESEVDTK